MGLGEGETGRMWAAVDQTVQAPQSPTPQACFVPVNFTLSRRTSIKEEVKFGDHFALLAVDHERGDLLASRTPLRAGTSHCLVTSLTGTDGVADSRPSSGCRSGRPPRRQGCSFGEHSVRQAVPSSKASACVAGSASAPPSARYGPAHRVRLAA